MDLLWCHGLLDGFAQLVVHRQVAPLLRGFALEAGARIGWCACLTPTTAPLAL